MGFYRGLKFPDDIIRFECTTPPITIYKISLRVKSRQTGQTAFTSAGQTQHSLCVVVDACGRGQRVTIFETDTTFHIVDQTRIVH